MSFCFKSKFGILKKGIYKARQIQNKSLMFDNCHNA